MFLKELKKKKNTSLFSKRMYFPPIHTKYTSSLETSEGLALFVNFAVADYILKT